MSKKKVADLSQYEFKDMFGKDIKPGDYIVYSAVDGRSGTLRAGQVIELKIGSPDWHGNPTPKVFVKSWSNFRAEQTSYREPDKEFSGRQKNVTLSFLDRLIVVPEDQVSEKIKKDLAGPAYSWDGTVLAK